MEQATLGVRQNPGQYRPGQSGNPLGPFAVVKAGVDELYDVMVVDYENLTGVDQVQLRAAARLFYRAGRTKNPDIAVRASALGQRILVSLEHKKRKPVGPPPLREQLVAQFAAKASEPA
jgi:hypothetical protein